MSDETTPSNDLSAASADVVIVPLLADLQQMIQAARERAAVAVNAELTLLYWHIGARLRSELLREQRAEYGKQVVDTIAAGLTAEFGNGFGRRNLFRMIQFAEQFPEEQIVSTLSAQLSWSHILELLVIKDELARRFYTEMCRLERWSVRTLRDRINSMLYERTALSKKPEELIRQELSALTEGDRLTPDLVFRDPTCCSSSGWWTRSASRNSPTRSCARSSASCWRWDATSRSWRVSGASSSTGWTMRWTCCCTTAPCAGWSW